MPWTSWSLRWRAPRRWPPRRRRPGKRTRRRRSWPEAASLPSTISPNFSSDWEMISLSKLIRGVASWKRGGRLSPPILTCKSRSVWRVVSPNTAPICSIPPMAPSRFTRRRVTFLPPPFCPLPLLLLSSKSPRRWAWVPATWTNASARVSIMVIWKGGVTKRWASSSWRWIVGAPRVPIMRSLAQGLFQKFWDSPMRRLGFPTIFGTRSSLPPCFWALR
mmetsp:Transcript_21151/g.38286  ORF Transcript_21151/g.38286 Transcript_21151/m.38286 type:complete len:219 (+) Transcript_21151:1020-1676(+)